MVITFEFKTETIQTSEIYKIFKENEIWMVFNEVFSTVWNKCHFYIEHRFLCKVIDVLQGIGVNIFKYKISRFQRRKGKVFF